MVKQILDNQEKAEKWDIHGTDGCQVVWNEKLKIEQEKNNSKKKICISEPVKNGLLNYFLKRQKRGKVLNKQQTVDIIRSILDHPQWEAEYLFELIECVVDATKGENCKK